MSDLSLLSREYRGVRKVSGPLLFVESASDLPYAGTVTITGPAGAPRNGQVIEVSDEVTVVQVFEDTMGLDAARTSISLVDREARLGVSEDLIGRVLDGSGRPRDGLPRVVADAVLPVSGVPINPISREKPRSFIHTGVSAIDGFNTLVRGQKLPVFSGAGLPGNEIAAQVLRQSRVTGESESFVIVFAAIGITQREAAFFLSDFEGSGAKSRTVTFLNLADDPTIERLLTPRCALTAAEYLAFERGYEVLVLMTDMTSYCEALREIGTAREEIPGRRGYPGYMYTDLASLYERAGRIKGRRGSVTLLPILTMPDDDITHPIPDLTGYITEGPGRPLPPASPQGRLSAHRRPALPVASHEQRHREGPHEGRPPRALQPAVLQLCPGPGDAAPGGHRRRGGTRRAGSEVPSVRGRVRARTDSPGGHGEVHRGNAGSRVEAPRRHPRVRPSADPPRFHREVSRAREGGAS